MVTLQEIQQREEELRLAQQQNQAIANEPIPQRRFGAGVTPQLQQQYLRRQESAQQNLQIISQQQTQLQDARRQLAEQESRGSSINNEINDAETARKYAVRGKIPFYESKHVKELYYRFKDDIDAQKKYVQSLKDLSAQQEQAKAQGFTPIIINGKIVGYNDEVNFRTIPAVNIVRAAQQDPVFAKRAERAGLITIERPSGIAGTTLAEQIKLQSLANPEERYAVQSNVPQQKITTGQNINVESAIEKPKERLDKFSFKLKSKREELSIKEIRGKGTQLDTLYSLGIGASLGLVSVARTVRHPIKSIKNIAETVPFVVERIGTGKGFPEVSQSLLANPASFIGEQFTTFYLIPKGATKVTTLTIDVLRTTGLKELPAKNIIAPEFFEGQTYPAIRKGQTAGELLKEFSLNKLEGENKPAGYTAAPKPLPKNTEVLRGSSEFPALYQAPLVSPKFLGLSSEGEKLFSFSPIGTIRPSIMRVTPEEIILAEGVVPSQKNLASLTKIRKFIETAPKGKSYIPFVKTEKEAVIPYETALTLVRKRFFIKFEGRKVPILEFETLTSGAIKETPTLKATSAKEIYGSYYRPRQRPLISSLNLISSSYTRSSNSFISSSYSIAPSSLYPSSFYSKLSSGTSFTPSRSGTNYNPSTYRTGSLSSSSLTYGSGYRTPSLPSIPRIPNVPRTPNPSTKSLRSSSKQFKQPNFLAGYKTFVIKAGKKTYLQGIRPRGKALLKGEEVARNTLRATFGIEPSSISVTESDLQFNPSSSFRGYRIRRGKRIPLVNEFIQKKGKRLSSLGEVQEIKLARLRGLY